MYVISVQVRKYNNQMWEVRKYINPMWESLQVIYSKSVVFPGTLVSSTNKKLITTIFEILLKVALKHHKPTKSTNQFKNSIRPNLLHLFKNVHGILCLGECCVLSTLFMVEYHETG